jgi:hypothetical protein
MKLDALRSKVVDKASAAKLGQGKIDFPMDFGPKIKDKEDSLRSHMVSELHEEKLYLRLDVIPSKMLGYLSWVSLNPLKDDDVYAFLSAAGIKGGLKVDELDRKTVGVFFPIATGTQPVDGRAGSLGLERREFVEGSKSFDNFDPIFEGDVIARIIPEEPGVPGHDIFGGKKDPVELPSFACQTNEYITKVKDKDGLRLVAKAAGHLVRKKDMLFLKTRMVISEKFTAHHGHLNYSSDILCESDVENANISTDYDIKVEKAVMASTLECRDLMINEGYHGQGKGSIQCRSYRGTYINDGFVEADEEIRKCESIYGSTVITQVLSTSSAKVSGSKLFVHVDGSIGDVGLESSDCILVIGTSYYDYQLNHVVLPKIEALDKEREELLAMAKKGGAAAKENINEKLEKLDADISDLKYKAIECEAKSVDRNEKVVLKVNGRIGQGTTIIHGEDVLVVPEQRERVQIYVSRSCVALEAQGAEEDLAEAGG